MFAAAGLFVAVGYAMNRSAVDPRSPTHRDAVRETMKLAAQTPPDPDPDSIPTADEIEDMLAERGPRLLSVRINLSAPSMLDETVSYVEALTMSLAEDTSVFAAVRVRGELVWAASSKPGNTKLDRLTPPPRSFWRQTWDALLGRH